MKQLKELMRLMEKQKKNASPSRAGSKTLNDTLKTRKGGAHYSPQSDYVRAKEKAKVRRELNESEGVKYFSYTVRVEEKDYSGRDNNRDYSEGGVTTGQDANSVKDSLKKSYRGLVYDIKLSEISKEEYKKRLDSED